MSTGIKKTLASVLRPPPFTAMSNICDAKNASAGNAVDYDEGADASRRILKTQKCNLYLMFDFYYCFQSTFIFNKVYRIAATFRLPHSFKSKK